MDKEAVTKAIEGMLKYGDFCYLTSDVLSEFDINTGDIVFISGTQTVPEDVEDIYTLRLKMMACVLDGDHVQTDKFYLIDPRNLERVPEDVGEKLTSILEEDFKEPTESKD